MYVDKVLILLNLISISFVGGQFLAVNPTTPDTEEAWTGRWLPERPSADVTTAYPDIHDDKHGVKMGVSSPLCDDAKTNLTVDWDFSPINYTCYTREKISPDWKIKPVMQCEPIPKFYMARHACMDEPINYDSDLPTFGTHRPLWPRYGEYKFVPRQRWIHNLEHGAVVMLYHPCANQLEVDRLKWLVKRCLFRHIITPYTLLDTEKPLALVTWGCSLSMSVVQPDIVQNFIKQHARNGPEHVSRDGQYDLGLLEPAQVLSSEDDDVLCPRH